MKNKKTVIIIVSLLLILLIGMILIYSVIKNNKLRKENINDIKTAYNDLTTNVKSYNEIRTTYNEMLSNFILETYKDSHEDYQELLNNYNEVVKKIDNSISVLNGKCDILYDDADINKICSGYKLTYEKLINIYVRDLNIYNENLKKYNEYKEDTLEEFDMIHENYIDYNNDGNYEGSGTNEEN